MKNWIITFRDKEKEPVRITEEQAYKLMEVLRDKTVAYLEIWENNKLEQIIDKKEVKQITKSSEESTEGWEWVCDWGNRHPMAHGVYTDQDGNKQWTAINCGCEKLFGCSSVQMMEWLRKEYNCERPFDAHKFMHDRFLKEGWNRS